MGKYKTFSVILYNLTREHPLIILQMDNLYNKNDVEHKKFDPLNNYACATLCKTHNAVCNSHKLKLAFIYKKDSRKLSCYLLR